LPGCLPTRLQARDPATGKVYIVAESRLGEIPGAVPKKGKGKKGEEQKGFEVRPGRAGPAGGGDRAGFALAKPGQRNWCWG
jgi:hypothetical protein